VKLLIDESLQQDLARTLTEAGHDAVHVTDLGLGDASDDEIMVRAGADRRIIVTADTDFGTLLALTGASVPASSCSADPAGAPRTAPGRCSPFSPSSTNSSAAEPWSPWSRPGSAPASCRSASRRARGPTPRGASCRSGVKDEAGG
jgi:hypothetical protein